MFKNIFSASHSSLPDFSALKIDMHSHLIPGIDDGSKNMGDSADLARRMYRLGYRKMITTPHIQQEFFRNTPETILNGLEKVRKELRSENVPMEVQAAAEYLINRSGFEEKVIQREFIDIRRKILTGRAIIL